jgi:pimeloyl-ACP methyl ester carboxylesterase
VVPVGGGRAGRRPAAQLGAGNSALTKPHDPAMWTPELYVREVDAVREALGLERAHVLGHTWGGMLAMQYALGQPQGLVSLVVESSPASVPGVARGGAAAAIRAAAGGRGHPSQARGSGHDVRVPTLLVSGRDDEVRPATVEVVHRGIPGSGRVLLEESPHTAQAEEPSGRWR